MFEGKNDNPYSINVKFVPQGNKTKVIWFVHTPRLPFLKRSLNLLSEDFVAGNIDQSMVNLSQLLSGKVDKEILLSKLSNQDHGRKTIRPVAFGN